MPYGSRYDLTGQRFGRLLVLGKAPRRPPNLHTFWSCLCDCGETTEVVHNSLKSGDTQSCGCLHRERTSRARKGKFTNPLRHNPIFNCWMAMVRRCTDPRVDQYPNYGGRGIRVCERWLRLENFYADMGERPSLDHTIDRINNDGDYEPGNCRWATGKQQSNNRRTNHLIEFEGQTRTLAEWAKIKNINKCTLKGRLARGLSIEEALTMPLQPRNKSA